MPTKGEHKVSKQERIEEMANAVMCAMEYRENIGTPHFAKIAQNLVNAGYGNLKEFVKRLKETLQVEINKLNKCAMNCSNIDGTLYLTTVRERNRIIDDVNIIDELLKEYME